MKISGTLLLVTAVTAFSRNSIDNEIIGEPTVNCEDSLVGLTFDTKKPFSGRVYVYGMAGDENCSRAFVEKRNQSRIATTFKNGDCTMQRQRVSGKVQGFISSIVVVVSFHGTFVTKADRAFKCICYFRSQKTLRNVIEMSPIGTTELLNTMPTPVCTYTIHSQSADGPILMMGAVGEKVYHVWKCDSMATRFLLHSCSVGDGRGDKVDLIDVDGCAVDPAIQPDVHYDDSNRAVVEVSGYKFSDATVLNYECVLELCRSDAECDRLTPPNCDRKLPENLLPNPTRRIRAVAQEATESQDRLQIEVAATLTMEDRLSANVVGSGSDLVDWRKNQQKRDSSLLSSTVCFPTVSLFVTLALMAVILITSIATVYYVARYQTYVVSPKK